MDCQWQLSTGNQISVDPALIWLVASQLEQAVSSADVLADIEDLCQHDGAVLLAILDALPNHSDKTSLGTLWGALREQGAKVASFLRGNFPQGPVTIGFSKPRQGWGLPPHCDPQRFLRALGAKVFPDLSPGVSRRVLNRLAPLSFWKSLIRRHARWSWRGTSQFVWVARWPTALPLVSEGVGQGRNEQPKPLAVATSTDEKLQALRRLAYGASHEINNPLANITMRAEALARTEADPDRRKKLLVIRQQAWRAHQMICDLMLVAHPPQLEVTWQDWGALLHSIGQDFSQVLATSAITLDVSSTIGFEACVDSKQIRELVWALLQNARESLGQQGRIQLELLKRTEGYGVAVEDTGMGIADELLPVMFDPFVSGREAGRGLGFGLTKAWRIASQHGGELRCTHSKPGKTRFELILPYPAVNASYQASVA